jgi:hypothetical protein
MPVVQGSRFFQFAATPRSKTRIGFINIHTLNLGPIFGGPGHFHDYFACFGSFADVCGAKRRARFAPESRHCQNGQNQSV